MTVNLALLGLEQTHHGRSLYYIFGRFRLFGAVLNISVMSALADIADGMSCDTQPEIRGFSILYEHFC